MQDCIFLILLISFYLFAKHFIEYEIDELHLVSNEFDKLMLMMKND